MLQQLSPHSQPPLDDLQAAIDRLLITHGAYIPVELLLYLGRLRYSDYEEWRCGRLPSLEAALCGDGRDASRLLLHDAARWAGKLGLTAERHVYFGWGDNAGHELSFGDGGWADADELLATHYVPSAEFAAGQLDIFIHSSTMAALATLRAALRARDPVAAGHALANLRSKEPEHRLLPVAEHLIDALADLSESLSPEWAETELRNLEHVLEPAARAVLGSDARGLLTPFWRRLASALAGLPFDPQRASLHASYAYSCCHDWHRAANAVLETPDYRTEPELLARLAEARRRYGDRKGAIGIWFQLCWQFPAAAGTLLHEGRIPDLKLREAWLEFRDLDLDPPADIAMFPAYLLLNEPGLAGALGSDLAAGDSDGEEAYCAVRRLLCRDDIAARKAVRAAAPWLLRRYLEKSG